VGATTDTRARMINSAALLLREHGVAGTSIARVLEHSQGPRGSVQFHFPGGKAQLLTEALVWAGGLISNVLSQAQARGDTPADVVNAICEHYKRQLADSDRAKVVRTSLMPLAFGSDNHFPNDPEVVALTWRFRVPARSPTGDHFPRCISEVR